MGAKLDAGETLPTLDLKLVGGDSVRLPDQVDSPYAVILFYRGHW
jgi:peroxiredoxin